MPLLALLIQRISAKFSRNVKEKDSRRVDGDPPGPSPVFYRLGWVPALRVRDGASGRVLSQGLKVLWQMQTCG